MFLYHLPESLIEPFLDLAYTLISADGKITEEEQSNFSLYAVELNMEQLPKCKNVNYENELRKFTKLSPSVKKELYFELIALAYADSEYEENERKLLDVVKTKFAITDSDAQKIEDIVIKLINIYNILGSVINE